MGYVRERSRDSVNLNVVRGARHKPYSVSSVHKFVVTAATLLGLYVSNAQRFIWFVVWCTVLSLLKERNFLCPLPPLSLSSPMTTHVTFYGQFERRKISKWQRHALVSFNTTTPHHNQQDRTSSIVSSYDTVTLHLPFIKTSAWYRMCIVHVQRGSSPKGITRACTSVNATSNRCTIRRSRVYP